VAVTAELGGEIWCALATRCAAGTTAFSACCWQKWHSHGQTLQNPAALGACYTHGMVSTIPLVHALQVLLLLPMSRSRQVLPQQHLAVSPLPVACCAALGLRPCPPAH
jgi:hypothetical protein